MDTSTEPYIGKSVSACFKIGLVSLEFVRGTLTGLTQQRSKTYYVIENAEIDRYRFGTMHVKQFNAPLRLYKKSRLIAICYK